MGAAEIRREYRIEKLRTAAGGDPSSASSNTHFPFAAVDAAAAPPLIALRDGVTGLLPPLLLYPTAVILPLLGGLDTPSTSPSPPADGESEKSNDGRLANDAMLDTLLRVEIRRVAAVSAAAPVLNRPPSITLSLPGERGRPWRRTTTTTGTFSCDSGVNERSCGAGGGA